MHGVGKEILPESCMELERIFFQNHAGSWKGNSSRIMQGVTKEIL
jgi:hypothetical protein